MASSHSQASFLGLPVELRLQIYEHLAEHVNDERRTDAHRTFHSNDSRFRRLTILTTSKQVFAEAMPVIYSKVEVGPILVGIPQYAAKWVERVVVACEYSRDKWHASYSLSRKDVIVSLLWRHLRETFPGIAEIRIVVPTAYNDTVSGKADLGSVSGISSFASLRMMVIQRPGKRGGDETARRIGRWHANKIGNVVRRELKGLGKGLEVVEVISSRP